MKSLGRFLLWSLVFLLILAGLDQLLVRVRLRTPVLAQGQDFYREFRGRILSRPRPPARPQEPEERLRRSRPSSPGPRYVYVDGSGAIQFADSLEEVPAPFRGEARSLER